MTETAVVAQLCAHNRVLLSVLMALISTIPRDQRLQVAERVREDLYPLEPVEGCEPVYSENLEVHARQWLALLAK